MTMIFLEGPGWDPRSYFYRSNPGIVMITDTKRVGWSIRAYGVDAGLREQ